MAVFSPARTPALPAAHTIHRCLGRMMETGAAWRGAGIFLGVIAPFLAFGDFL